MKFRVTLLHRRSATCRDKGEDSFLREEKIIQLTALFFLFLFFVETKRSAHKLENVPLFDTRTLDIQRGDNIRKTISRRAMQKRVTSRPFSLSRARARVIVPALIQALITSLCARIFILAPTAGVPPASDSAPISVSAHNAVLF